MITCTCNNSLLITPVIILFYLPGQHWPWHITLWEANKHTTFCQTHTKSTDASTIIQHTTYVQMATPGKPRVVTYLNVSYMYKTT